MQRTITQKIYCFFHVRVLALILLMASGLFSNAQYVNGSLSTGATAANGTAAPTGYTWSECQASGGVANTNSGYTANGTFSVVDDFVVPTGQTWNLTKVYTYGYLTGSTGTTSPLALLRVRIHSGNPSLGPTTIVFGDLTTNRLTAATDALMYRIFNTVVPAPAATTTTRKIWKLEAAISVSLPAGTYWIEFQDDAGFVPASTPVGVRTLPGYNALQGNSGVYTALQDAGNPTTVPSVNMDLPFGVDYTTAACAAPALPTATATPSTVASGNPSTLAVTAGALNSATAWKWYSGSCGGTLVGTGTSIVVNPTVTTTYYVRGEGGCVTPGACTAITVNVGGSCISPATATICAGVIQPLSTVGSSSLQSFTSTVPVAIPASPNTGVATGDPANPYPTTIAVAALPTTGVTVASVTISGLTHTFPNDIDMVLQSPSGTNVILMSDVGGTSAPAAPLNYTFDDNATASLTTGSSPSGTYKPTNSGTPDAFPAPGPGSLTQVTPTLASFTGDPNGGWKLYIVDDAGGDIGSITGFTITFNVPAAPTAVWSPITGLYSNAGATIPYVAGTPASIVYAKPAGTTTYTAAYSSGPCAASTNNVTVTVNPIPTVAVTPTSGCSPLTMTASGATTYSWTPAAGLSATTGATVTATPTANTVYTVTGTTAGCSNTATASVSFTPPAPTVFPAPPVSACLGTPQPISITTAAGFGAPVTVSFPSGTLNLAIPENVSGISHTVNVSGIPTGAVITAASVTLNISHTYVGDCMISLKAPNNNILNLDNLLNGTNNPGANFTNTIIGSTGTTALSAGVAPFTALFKADGNTGATGAFGVPSGATGFAPNTPTFAGLYSVPNGPWTIAMYDAGPPDVGSLTNWTLNITYTPIVPFTGIFTPNAGLFLDAAGTVPYAGTSVSTVYAKPPASTTYSVTIANGTCVSPATSIPVTVNTPVAITTQPANAAVCTDKTTSFTIVTTGTTPVHNWQVSTNGGTSYTTLANGGVYSGVNTATLVITAPPVALNGNRYRDSISGTSPCGFVNSASAILTVNPLPTITLTAAPYTRLYPGLTTTISVAVTPVPAATYTWFRNGIQIPGATTGSYVVNVDGFGDYSVRVTDANGCTNTSGIKTIADSANSTLFIYPNPNSGTFQVRYYSLPNNVLARNLFIYDAKGSRVYTQTFSIGTSYAAMNVNLKPFGTGTYWVVLSDKNGKRIKIGKVVIF